ncbi:MAG: hypothetical protein FWE84_00840 [Firmicutes bacterium]|nr:hypothetical protein [Bacillota bacterium]
MKNIGLSKEELRQFRADLKQAAASKDVEKSPEHILIEAIKKFYNNKNKKKRGSDDRYGYYSLKVEFPHGTDGVIRITNQGLWFKDNLQEALILLETKRDVNFSQKEEQAKAIAQAIYYIKKFEKAGDTIPQVTIIADINQIFAVPTSLIVNYLTKSHDWNIAPSKAWHENASLYNELCNDHNLVFLVHNMQKEHFDFNEFMGFVDAVAFGEKPVKIKVTKDTLLKAFENFLHIVFGGHAPDKNMWQMSLFIQSLLGNQDVYLHPNKPNTVVINGKDYRNNFNTTQYQLFFNKYDKNNYTLSEQKQITEIADTLLKEAERRYTGDFWTPEIWVERAHEMIEEQLGEDWKEKYVVWEAACGTKNLTRDYKFAQLYNSTLHQEELNISVDYNPEAIETFQYDFLNDDIHLHLPDLLSDKIPTKMPKSLFDALKAKKPIVFFMNPPYGQAGSEMGKESKTGITTNAVSDMMKNFSQAKNELYCQFIYRTMQFAKTFGYEKDFFFFFFFNKGFLTSPEYAKFTELLCSKFTFQKGFMFNAGEFNGTSSRWGVIFSHWKIGGGEQKSFLFDVLYSEGNKIKKSGKWEGKKSPDKKATLGSYARSHLDLKRDKENVPVAGFAISKAAPKLKTDTSFGWFQDHGNLVQKAYKDTSLSTGGCCNGGCFVQADNFERCMIAFSVRKAMLEKIAEQKLLWVRDKDVFRKPSDKFQKSKEFASFTADCVVYSLFASGSNQTSLRDFEYNGKKHDIRNEFFWLSKKHVAELAQEHKNREIERDASVDKERFVYKWLGEHKADLSIEAGDLLRAATEILENSFKYRYRYTYEQNKERYNLQSWDAGWLQIYKMIASKEADGEAKAALKGEYDNFKVVLRRLGDKIAALAESDGMI